jgi:hypothetical protein
MTHKFQYSKKFADGGIVVVGGSTIEEFEANYGAMRGSAIVQHLISPQKEVRDNPPDNDPSWCEIHLLTMDRYEKDGRSWFSHKVDGNWCKGK